MSKERQALVVSVGQAIQAYQRATDGFDDAVGRVLRLNPTDLRCLDWLTEGAMTAGRLAAATGLSSAATTSMLDRLETRGLIVRDRARDDRRKVNVRLSPEGGRSVAALYGPLAGEGGRLLARFSDAELAMILDFLAEATEVVDRHRSKISAKDL